MPMTAEQRAQLLAVTPATPARPRPQATTTSTGRYTPPKQQARIGGNTKAGSLLRDRLNTIQRYAPNRAAQAEEVARGGGGSMIQKALFGALNLIDVPRRAVIAGIEETAEFLNPSLENEFSFGENVSNPTYGVGTILERQHPGMNIWLKRGLGLVGDLASDPMTYLTFGSSAAIKELGAKGVARLAFDGAEMAAKDLGDDLLAKELRSLGARVGEKGVHSLTDDEMRLVMKMGGNEKLANAKGFFGPSVNLPFAEKGTSALPGFGKVGRTWGRVVEREGALGRWLGRTAAGKALGGEERRQAAKELMRSGDVSLSEMGVRLLDAMDKGSAVNKQMAAQMQTEWQQAAREMKKAGVDWTEAMEALRGRPIRDVAEGAAEGAMTAPTEAYVRATADPAKKAAIDRVGAFFDSLPGATEEASRHGQFSTAFLQDATEAGRPYAPRIMSDEFQEQLGKRLKFPSSAEKRAWFERKALGIGDEVIPGEEGTRLVAPGTVNEAGEVAASLETQIQKHVDDAFGENAVKWYEDDLSKVMPRYIHGIAQQTGNYKTLNYLQAHGMADRWVEWTLDAEGNRIGVKALKAELTATRDALEQRVRDNAASLVAVEAKADQALAALREGKITTQQYESIFEATQVHKSRLLVETRAADERLAKAGQEVVKTQAERRTAREALESATRQLDEHKAALAAKQVEIDALTRQIDALPANAPGRKGTFEQFKKLVAEREAVREQIAQASRAPVIVAAAEEEAVNSLKVAQAIRNALADPTGQSLDINAPYMETVADMLRVEPEMLGNAELERAADMFERMANDRLAFAREQGVPMPADMTREGAEAATAEAWDDMNQALIDLDEGVPGAEQAYVDHVDRWARAYSLESRWVEDGPPSVADLISREAKLTSEINTRGGQRDIEAAMLATQADAYEGRLNSFGYTMYPEKVGQGAETVQSFLGNEVAPGTFVGPDGITRRVVVDPVPTRSVRVGGTTVQENLVAQRAVASELYRITGAGFTPTTYLGAAGVAMEVPPGSLPLSEVVTMATPEQQAVLARQYLDGAAIDLLFGAELGMGDVMRTEGGRLLRFPQQVGLTSNRHISDQVDRMIYGTLLGDATGIQQGLLKTSSLTQGEVTTELVQSWERLLTVATHQANSGTGIDWRIFTRKVLGPEAGEEVGNSLNRRFSALVSEFEDVYGVDTDGVMREALDMDAESLGNFGAMFDPDYRVFQGSPGLKQADLPPPGRAQSWSHVAQYTAANPAGDVRLDSLAPVGRSLEYANEEYFDWLWGPNITATDSLVALWRDVRSGGDAVVHHPTIRTIPERVKVYGAPSLDAVAKETKQGGEVSARGLERFSTRGTAPLEEGAANLGTAGGRGMDFLAIDLYERLARVRPDLVEALTPGMSPQARDAFAQAARHQMDAEVHEGIRITMADALEMQARHDAGMLDLNDGYARALRQLPRDRHRPMAAGLTSHLLFGEVDDGLREARKEMAYVLRDSIAADADVLMTVTSAPGAAFVHALPTSQIAMSFPESVGGDALAFVRETEQGFKDASKIRAQVTKRNKSLAARQAAVRDVMEAWPETYALENQFSIAQADVASAQYAVDAATAEYADAVAKARGPEAVRRAARLKNISEYERDMAQKAVDHAFEQDDLMANLAKIDANYAGLRRQALELDYDQDWNHALFARHEQDFARLLHDGWRGFGFGFQAPNEVADVLATTSKHWDPASGSGIAGVLTSYDRIHNWLKGWLTTSPGFHFRNFFGGTFNNWMAGVDVVKSTLGWGNLYRKAGRGATLDALDAGERALFESLDGMGILRSGTFYEEFAIDMSEGASLNPFAGAGGSRKQFVLPWLSRKSGEQTEAILRGTMAYDMVTKAMRKGEVVVGGQTIRSLDQVTPEMIPAFVEAVNGQGSRIGERVMDQIAKYHFDYSDLSSFERNVARRVIPFYTWTRRNIPLQLELMATRPQGIQAYFHVKRNLELGTEDEPIVPSYFGEQFMIHTPWSSRGSDLYGTIDLPFKDPFKLADPMGLGLSSVSPLLKTPVEAWAGKQFFSDVPLRKDLKVAPKAWTKVPGLMQALSVVGRAQRSPKDGEWYMREKDAYVVGQYIPFLNQARRLLPSEPKYQNRVASTYASYVTGVMFRANTPQDQEAEVFRRSDKLERAAKDLQQMGVIPKGA